MKRIVVSLLYLLSPAFLVDCPAIDLLTMIDARSCSMGYMQSSLPGFTNPASYGFVKSSRNLSLQYINRYGMKELSTWSACVNYPNQYLNAGLIISRYGMKAYHETFAGLNIYRKLSGHISLGIRINYQNMHYSDKQPNQSVVTGDVGMYVLLPEHFYLSILAINPFCISMKTGNSKEKLPSVFYVGANYEPVETFVLTAEIEKNLVLPVCFKLGFEYNPVKELSVRAGMFTSPLTPSFGIGLHLLPFTADLAFLKHSALGFQTCCTLRFEF